MICQGVKVKNNKDVESLKDFFVTHGWGVKWEEILN